MDRHDCLCFLGFGVIYTKRGLLVLFLLLFLYMTFLLAKTGSLLYYSANRRVVPNTTLNTMKPGYSLLANSSLPNPCRTRRRFTGIQDILCLRPLKFLPNYKNPCWYEGKLLRCLPYFHLIGVCKSGTSDFFKRIYVHPDIIPNKGIFGKETYFWSWKRFMIRKIKKLYRPMMTLRDFTDQFKATMIEKKVVNMSGFAKYRPLITGHGDPMDFWDNLAWRKTPQNDLRADEPLWTTPASVRHINPDVKLLLMVRNPVDRLYSHYFHARHGNSSQMFHGHVIASLALWQKCTKDHTVRACAYNNSLGRSMKAMLHTGLYSVHLREWLRFFSLQQIFVFRNEDYKRDIIGTMKRVFKFLDIGLPSELALNKMQNLPRFFATKRKQGTGPMKLETRKILESFYRPYMEEFAQLLGDDRYRWSSKCSS